MRLQRFFWSVDDSGFNAVRIAVIRWFLAAKPALNTPCQDKGMPSRAARGDRKLGADGCRGTSWSKELDDKELRGALGGERDLELSGLTVP